MGSRGVWHPSAVPRVLVLVAVLFGLAGCGTDDPASGPSLGEQMRQLEGAPKPLADVHAEANELLDGGPSAFRERLEQLEGYPVVVNKWASWCAPCREEFPVFQRVGAELGTEVAFLGVASNDNDEAARDFLGRYPVSYPTYTDPTLRVAAVFNATLAWPSTAFYDEHGELAYLKQGPYHEDEELVADIEEHAR